MKIVPWGRQVLKVECHESNKMNARCQEQLYVIKLFSANKHIW